MTSNSNDDRPPAKDVENESTVVTVDEQDATSEAVADLIPTNKQASWLVRISIKNPYLVIVLCLLICVLG